MSAGEEKAELVRKIVEEARGDAMEILVLISLMKCQSTAGVNDRLNDTAAVWAGAAISNALRSYLVTIITRQYSPLHRDDLHLRRAFDILNDSEISSEFQRDGSNDLCDAQSYFEERCKDGRFERISHFRNKVAVHRGKLRDDIPMPTYDELFFFAHATIDAIEKLALAIPITRRRVRDDVDAEGTAAAFWHPWRIGANQK